jgi:protease IV
MKQYLPLLKRKNLIMMLLRRYFFSLFTLLFIAQSHESKTMDWITPKTLLAASATLGLSAAAFYYKYKAAQRTHIALITYNGPIMAVEQTDLLLRKLTFVRDTPWISGLILTIESGGGAPGQSELIYHTIQEIVAIKPVVVLVVDVCASGAYLGCCPATIVAPALSTLGCIGVLNTVFKVFPEKFDQDGTQGTLEIYPFAAGKFKSIHNQHAPLTDETKAEIQREIDALYDAFLQLVMRVRPSLTMDQKDEWAEGRSFNGIEALKLGLIDYVGGLPTAQAVMKYQLSQRAGHPVENIQFVELI